MNHDDFFKQADNEMKWFGRIFWFVFAVAAIIIVGTWSFYGFVAYKVISDPAVIGRTAGQIMQGFIDETEK